MSASLPVIDERRVWQRVQAGMRAQPQRSAQRFPTLPRVAALLALAPRPLLAGGLAVALLMLALAGSMLLQPRESASAAFLERVEQMAQAAQAAAEGPALSGEQSVALEQRALGLLEHASGRGTLQGLGATEKDRAYERLREARSSLAAVVGENPGDTRALAALAAISGLLEPSEPAPGAPFSIETATAEAGTTSATAPSGQGRGSDADRTPEATGSSGESGAQGANESTAGAAVSAAQIACARAYDVASLSACTSATSTALAACAQARGANGCQQAIEAALSSAQARVQRVGEDCQRLPNSRARDACSEATNKASARSNSGRGNESGKGNSNERSGGGQQQGSDSPGRRD